MRLYDILCRTRRGDTMTKITDWFDLAYNDLNNSDTPARQCFNAQQAIEKSLKTILAAENLNIPHTHDISIAFQYSKFLVCKEYLYECA